LPPWRETFIARYPRKLKVAVAGAFVLLLVLSPVIHGLLRPLASKASVTASKLAAPAVDSKGRATGETVQQAVKAGDISATAPALNDPDDRGRKMAAAPDPGLTEDTSQGSLPRIGEDGRQPWQVYGRDFNQADRRPRVAIVITDLGLSRAITNAAISRLSPSVTLAFDAQSPVTGAWLNRARQEGHEVLLETPMEPFDFPRSDPGPNTLLTTLPNSDNIVRFRAALRQGTGYVGVTTLSGSRFTTAPDKLKPILDELRARGLMVFDARVAPHSALMDLARDNQVPTAVATQRFDQNLAPDAIDGALEDLAKTTLLNGRAVGIAEATPVLLDHLQAWLKTLPQRGIALAPVSAMVL
jgi:polysaccharide deacetylase 2 family uncharacterized protein YibQ